VSPPSSPPSIKSILPTVEYESIDEDIEEEPGEYIDKEDSIRVAVFEEDEEEFPMRDTTRVALFEVDQNAGSEEDTIEENVSDEDDEGISEEKNTWEDLPEDDEVDLIQTYDSEPFPLSVATSNTYSPDLDLATSEESPQANEKDQDDEPSPKRPRLQKVNGRQSSKRTKNTPHISNVNEADLFSKTFDQPLPYYPEPFDPDHPMMKGVKALDYDYALLSDRELDNTGERRIKNIGRKKWYWKPSPLRACLTAVKGER
jgi:hypothetical protein